MKKLTPIRKPPRSFTIGAFDVEGSAERFLLGAWVDADGRKGVEKDPQVLARRISKMQAARVFAHNAMYDLGVLFSFFPRKEVFVKSGRLIKARIGLSSSYKLLLDSYSFYPFSLETVGRIVGFPKLEKPFEESGEAIEWDQVLAEVGEDRLAEYCLRDAEIVVKAMSLFQEELNRLGGEMKATLAGTAMDLFRRRFLDREYPLLPPDVDGFIRQAYYGGRTENYVFGEVRGIYVYDVNSMYPYVMWKYEFPDSWSFHWLESGFSVQTIRDYEGVSEIDIEVPPLKYPPLPVKYQGKTVFPVGRLHGVWTHPEIRAALNRGAKIHRIYRMALFTETCRPFRSYVETLYGLRQEYKAKGDPREVVVKLLLNSLYGKFGENPERSALKRVVDYDRAMELNRKGWVVEIEELGDEEVGLVEEQRLGRARHSLPIWAAYVTAYARLELLGWMEKAGDVVYVDTDSVFTKNALPTGSALGELKLEGGPYSGIISNPKAYLLMDPEGKRKTASRGVPVRLAEEFIRVGRVTFQKAVKLLEAIRRGLKPSSWIPVTKESRTTFPKRQPSFGIGKTRATRPWRLQMF